MTNIYGVDLEGNSTPKKVLEVIINCFSQAHCLDSQLSGSSVEISHAYCEQLVRQKLKEVGGDFNFPTKESLVKLIQTLAQYSKDFRDKEVIKKHFDEIMVLINKL